MAFKDKEVTVGFTLIGRGGWTGGETYLRNMLRMISKRLEGKVKARLFLSPAQHANLGPTFDGLLSSPIIVDQCVETAGQGSRAIKSIVVGSDRAFANLVLANNIDVMFESAQWLGNQFPIPVISWIPDFQHRRMPHYFSHRAWWKRDLGFRLQTSGKRVIMLSSLDAKNDCEKYYPSSIGKTSVVSFVSDIAISSHRGFGSEMRKIYNLPERFYFLPNQFWRHKNHSIVVAALTKLKMEGKIDKVPAIILSGLNKDARAPQHFDSLMQEVKVSEIESHFNFLGLIPYEHVLKIIGCCELLINPSLSEGWSTPIEEAKTLGAALLLSDIPLHREQAPQALFFDANSIDATANALLHCVESRPKAHHSVSILEKAQNARLEHYASDFFNAIQMTKDLADQR